MKTRAANKIQTKLVTLLYGATFSGKTTLGLQLADFKRNDGKPFRVAVVDAEGGGVDDAVDDAGTGIKDAVDDATTGTNGNGNNNAKTAR